MDEKENHRHVQYCLTYGRKFFDKNKISIDANSGIIADKFFVTRAVYSYTKTPAGFEISHFDFYTDGRDPNDFDWGIPLEANFNYNLNKNAAVGLQAKAYYLLQIGIEGAYLTPSLKITF